MGRSDIAIHIPILRTPKGSKECFSLMKQLFKVPLIFKKYIRSPPPKRFKTLILTSPPSFQKIFEMQYHLGKVFVYQFLTCYLSFYLSNYPTIYLSIYPAVSLSLPLIFVLQYHQGKVSVYQFSTCCLSSYQVLTLKLILFMILIVRVYIYCECLGLKDQHYFKWGPRHILSTLHKF